MSWLGWGPATTPQFEELVEKACSPLNLPYPQSEDMATALEVTDLVRSKAVQPKPAMQSLKRRVASKNGRVQMYALGLIDTCIKNGGDHFLAEIASKEFVDEMSGLIKSPLTNAEVKQMAIRLFQSWALAFQSKKELGFFVDVYNELKNSGISFPPPPSHTSSHLLETTTAPTWVDSDVCMRCRTAFTFTNRKHHCRNCGLVFDQACSSRMMPLPRFGITDDVRVCEGCWMKSGRGKVNGTAPAVPGRTPRTREDLDADLQRAIELSLADSQPGVGSEPPLKRTNRSAEDDDEELRLAIEASLRDMEASAPSGADEPEYKPLPTFDLTPRETETILTFSNTLDQMAAYGERDLRRFPHAHVLYEQAYGIGGKLQRNAEEKNTKQQMLQEMQSKLSEAVGVYSQILDGQQAYTAQKLQEQQQRQYQSYAPQQYQPYHYPQVNGHYAPQYAPPQAPGLYPSMPNFQAAPQYTHQYSMPITSPPQQWAPSQPTIERSSSMRVPGAPNAPLQRHSSVTYGAEIAQAAPSAPPSQETAPPVDMASHPASSPTTSVHAPLPPSSAPQQYTSPSLDRDVPLSNSFSQTELQNQWAQPQQWAPQQVYSAASFPVAPAAVFPDAPTEEFQQPRGVEKHEQEEALLIEL
ncbi:hypothetical protein BCR39DRAFT_511030 [Naematelia encephala]|uniref:Vacuolar protein sorting-associated protein 27 n=1 Tax=Naematelia encephala TaxID=71784 RepID=A0A1Y2BLF7_9TREE|nr:hypothetical protein BCR39DRAFT_511030 [Naematelia encephala]